MINSENSQIPIRIQNRYIPKIKPVLVVHVIVNIVCFFLVYNAEKLQDYCCQVLVKLMSAEDINKLDIPKFLKKNIQKYQVYCTYGKKTFLNVSNQKIYGNILNKTNWLLAKSAHLMPIGIIPT